MKKVGWFSILVAAAVLTFAVITEAQQPGKMTRVGFLGIRPAPTPATPYAPLQAFRQSLDELPYVDGRDVVIEMRWAEGRIYQLPALAAELVGLRVDILVGVGAVVARAAKSATTTIPVVMAVVIDPVNLVAERPGGNLTGLTTFDPQEARKSSTPAGGGAWAGARGAPRGSSGAGHEGACRAGTCIGSAAAESQDRWAQPGSGGSLPGHKERARRRAPGPGTARDGNASQTHCRAGGAAAVAHLVCGRLVGRRGTAPATARRVTEATRRLAAYVDRIVKGGAARRPAFRESFVRPELIVNLKTAQEIGVTIPPEVLGSGQTGSYNEGISHWLDNRLARALPNNRLQLTASSVRSCVAPASGSG